MSDSDTAQVRRPHVLADGTTLDRTAASEGESQATRMAFGKNSTNPPTGGPARAGATPEKHAAAAPLPLQVLLLEDSPADAGLILEELRRGGYDPIARRVASREEMLEALKLDSWQIMLLDYTLGTIVTIVIMVYLVYALINPERF